MHSLCNIQVLSNQLIRTNRDAASCCSRLAVLFCVSCLQPAFPPELEGELGTGLIEAWGFTTGFCDMLGVPTFSTEALLSALLQGSSSPLLGLVHIILLRQAQADMEEAHATGVLQVGTCTIGSCCINHATLC